MVWICLQQTQADENKNNIATKTFIKINIAKYTYRIGSIY